MNTCGFFGSSFLAVSTVTMRFGTATWIAARPTPGVVRASRRLPAAAAAPVAAMPTMAMPAVPHLLGRRDGVGSRRETPTEREWGRGGELRRGERDSRAGQSDQDELAHSLLPGD